MIYLIKSLKPCALEGLRNLFTRLLKAISQFQVIILFLRLEITSRCVFRTSRK